MQQTPETIITLNKLLNNFQPSRIIELGTGLGGLTVLFGIWANTHDCRVYSCDVHIRDYKALALIEKLGVKFHEWDIYQSHDEYEIGSLIRWSNGPVLLMCDAADKPRSFNLYAQYLRSGDVIMAHDYYINEDDFKKYFHGYTAFETSEDSIKESYDKYNLIEHSLQKEFRQSGWCIRIKQ